METNIKSYRLKQEDKDYIFITSMVGRTIKLACKTSSGHTFSRKFTLNELKNFDKVFYKIKSLDEVIEFFDKALKIHKVGVKEERGKIKIIFYFTTKGITHQIDIPLIRIAKVRFISSTRIKEPYSIENIAQNQNYANIQKLTDKCQKLSNSNKKQKKNLGISENFGEFRENIADVSNTNRYLTQDQDNIFDGTRFLKPKRTKTTNDLTNKNGITNKINLPITNDFSTINNLSTSNGIIKIKNDFKNTKGIVSTINDLTSTNGIIKTSSDLINIKN